MYTNKAIPYTVYPTDPIKLIVEDANGSKFEIQGDLQVYKVTRTGSVSPKSGLPEFLIDFNVDFKTSPVYNSTSGI